MLSALSNFSLRRLRVQVIALSVFTIVISLGGFSWLMLKQQGSRLLEQSSHEAVVLAQNTASSTLEWVLREDIDKLSETALRVVASSAVNTLKITDASGIPITVVGRDKAGEAVELYVFDAEKVPETIEVTQKLYPQYVKVWVPIEAEAHAGWVILEYNLGSLLVLKKEIRQNAAKFVGLFAALALVVFWAVMTGPIKTIEGITAFSERLSDLTDEQLSVDRRTRETEKLAVTLNRTARELKANYLALEISNTQLEDRVKRRTQDLEKALTEQKRIEAQLVHTQKMESVGQLAAGIAHEINTPMQYIGDNVKFMQEASEGLLKFIDALRSEKPELLNSEWIEKLAQKHEIEFFADELPSALQQSLEGVSQVTKIVRSVKEFSHPGEDKQSIASVNKCLLSSINVSRNEWKYLANVETNLHASLPEIPIYVGELNQVFLNIIVNAAHAIEEKRKVTDTREKGCIDIATDVESAAVVVRITDSGAGMPEDVIGKIYDPFFTTKAIGKGTGQGLHIAWDVIVNKHGGTLNVQSEPGKGTTFEIKLPMETVEPGAED